jgi:hypothetical protein
MQVLRYRKRPVLFSSRDEQVFDYWESRCLIDQTLAADWFLNTYTVSQFHIARSSKTLLCMTVFPAWIVKESKMTVIFMKPVCASHNSVTNLSTWDLFTAR